MHVLVVEDDRALGLFLQKRLSVEGHEVVWAHDGREAMRAATQHAPDLIVLDLGLPDLDGIDVLQAVRRGFEHAAIVVVSGRSDVEQRVRCFDMGADDFVAKPFSFHELTARCRALLRRRERFADPMLRFGSLAMDRLSRCVTYEGVEVALTEREFRLLEFLLLRQGGCCTRAELLRQVWHVEPEAGTNIVDVYVTYLRKKLMGVRPQRRSESPIETVRGSGYRLRPAMWVPQGKDVEGLIAQEAVVEQVAFAAQPV